MEKNWAVKMSKLVQFGIVFVLVGFAACTPKMQPVANTGTPSATENTTAQQTPTVSVEPPTVTANPTARPTSNDSNISREEAISIARYWLEGSYGAKTENSPVNATPSVFGNVTAWNVTMTDVSGVAITGGRLPLEGAPPPPPYKIVFSGHAAVDMKTGAILAGGVGAQVVYLDK